MEGLSIIIIGIYIGAIFGVFLARIYIKRNKKRLLARAIEEIKKQKKKTIAFRDGDVEVKPQIFYVDGEKVDLEEDIKRDLAGLPPKTDDKKVKKAQKRKMKKSGSHKKEVKKPEKRRSKK